MSERDLSLYFASIVESADDAIISKDLNGIIQSFNGAAERIFGYTAKEIIGKSILTLIPPDRHGEESEILSRIRRGARVDHFETVRMAKDGHRVDISLTVSPMRDQSGKIVGASKIARDITNQKRSEERTRVLAAERERLLVAERTARADAERANRSKDDFVALVSHELRTPLNAILGWTELLRTQSHDPKTLETGLEVISRNTRHQAELISDLLDVSRIVSGQMRLELERVDLSAIVANSVQALGSVAAKKGVELVSQGEGIPPTVFGDPDRLQQIVFNLVSNAIKFTPAAGTVTVTLRTVNDSAEIIVTDTGAGIRQDFVPDLFEKFHQGSVSTTRRHGGLGLGLFIAKDLTELHGGTIRAWSAGENKGSTFTVELPLSSKDRHIDPDQLGPDATSYEEVNRVALDDMRVLLVEDDRDTRDLVRRLLETHQATVVVASSAPEALALAAREHPDILISDIGLPDVDGYQMIGQLRKMDGDVANIPAVALTAFARADDRARALRAGFNAHIAKPVEPAEFLATVSSFARLVTHKRHR